LSSDRLRELLAEKVRAADGDVSAQELEAIQRIAELIELRRKTTPPPRWPIAALFAAAVLVSLVLFVRVPETHVELQLVVSEVGFELVRPQAVTEIVNLRELGATGLRGSTDAMRLGAIDPGTLTLDPLSLAKNTDVRIDAARAPEGCRIVLSGTPAVIRTTAHGAIRIDVVGAESRTESFAIPRSIVLETDRGEASLDLVFAKEPAFAPQLFVRKLALTRIDDVEGSTPQVVSTILGGTIYFESLGGEARPLRPRELLRFDEIHGVIRTLELERGRIALSFNGTVHGMRRGWGAKPASLMPTWLAWLRAQHGLSLFWGTTLFLYGLATTILRWWKGRA